MTLRAPPLQAAISVGRRTGSGIAQICEPRRRKTQGNKKLLWIVEGGENNTSPGRKQFHKPTEMKTMRTTLECPETGRGSGRPTLESRESSNAEKGESKNIHLTQRHGCGSSVHCACTDLASENCTRCTGHDHTGQRHKPWMPKSQQNYKMGHHRVSYAPSYPQRPGLERWGTWTSPSWQTWGNCRKQQPRDKHAPPQSGDLLRHSRRWQRWPTHRWYGVWSQQQHCQRLCAFEYRKRRRSSYGTSMGWQEESPCGTRKSTTSGIPDTSSTTAPPGPWRCTTQQQRSWDKRRINSSSRAPDNLSESWQNSYNIPHIRRYGGTGGGDYVQQHWQ